MSVIRIYEANYPQASIDIVLSISLIFSYIKLQTISATSFYILARIIFSVIFITLFMLLIYTNEGIIQFIWFSTTIYLIFFVFERSEGWKWFLSMITFLIIFFFYDSDLISISGNHLLIWLFNMFAILLIIGWHKETEEESIGKLLNIQSLLSDTVKQKTFELQELNNSLEEKVKKEIEKILMRKASTDSLTGIMNRRAFFDTSAKEMNIAKRYNHDLSFLIIDIDYFKAVNDTYGHLNGDIVLRDLVNIIKNTIRTTDVFGRIGGEEFAILMPETEMKNAEKLAERIRQNVSNNESVLEDNSVNITVSIGLSFMKPKDGIIQNILRRADLALFKAKESGRNKLCCLDEV